MSKSQLFSELVLCSKKNVIPLQLILSDKIMLDKNKKLNVLLLGSGAREAAIAVSVAKSKFLGKFFASPGNPGICCVAKNITLEGFKQIGDFCKEENIDIIVVGPEQPLVDGIADYIYDSEDLRHIIVVGPKRQGAKLEGSKAFAKEFMIRHNIPTAKYKSFTVEDIQEGKKFLKTLKAPYVLKADGLAAGKGVLIVDKEQQAEEDLEQMLKAHKFGDASNKVVIEEFLQGIECSVFILTDGKNYVLLPEAKDYKRVGENDTGLNTGGMGSISPVSFCNQEFMDKVEQKIIRPTIDGLIQDGIDYQGFIFFGLMNVQGEPFVIEYNVRMGDPESESVFTRIESDLLEAFALLKDKKLDTYKMIVSKDAAASVVLCSKGYPEKYEKGKLIKGLDSVKGATLYHAGTKQEGDNILTNGGRVLVVTCLGKDIKQALEKCYQSIDNISFDNKYFRRDIGKDLVQ